MHEPPAPVEAKHTQQALQAEGLYSIPKAQGTARPVASLPCGQLLELHETRDDSRVLTTEQPGACWLKPQLGRGGNSLQPLIDLQ